MLMGIPKQCVSCATTTNMGTLTRLSKLNTRWYSKTGAPTPSQQVLLCLLIKLEGMLWHIALHQRQARLSQIRESSTLSFTVNVQDTLARYIIMTAVEEHAPPQITQVTSFQWELLQLLLSLLWETSLLGILQWRKCVCHAQMGMTPKFTYTKSTKWL